MDNTKRFSDRVDNYDKYRPSYTNEAISYIFNEFNLTNESVIADIGSGTGIFTEKIIPNSYLVYGVEPNTEMRSIAELKLGKYRSFKSINGTSDKTTIDANSIDAITVAQAFHWFDIESTKKEFMRILKKDSFVFLIWNKRLINTPFLEAYEEILFDKIPEYKVVNHKNISEEIIKKILEKDYSKRTFNNNQKFNLDGVLGRLSSSSYTPKPNTSEYKAIEKEIVKTFEKYSINNTIMFNYDTEIYSGRFA